MESVIIPVSQGGFVAATLWQRHKAKALVIVHPATAVVQGFYKGFAEYLYKRGFSVITYDYRGTGLSKSGRVRHNKKHHVRLDRAGRRMHHRVGESPSPWPYPAGDWAQYWRACRAVIFRLHRPASRRHGCLTRRRDKHYQPNEGKAASMVFTARFGAGTCRSLGICQPDVSGWVKIYRLRRCFSGDAGARCLNISMTTRSGMRVSGQER